MNPMAAAKQIEKHLQEYIRRTLPVERAMPEFTPRIEELFANYHMAQDPYLELMPGYRANATLQDLVEEEIIYQETADIFAQAFLGVGGNAANFTLYQHQADAIRAVCRDEKNLIVCSGTGSGKTECFLIPLVNHLVGQWIEAEKPQPWDAPGVRAMILYPMNALVNDQIRRLRTILRHAPYIRFGKYTGELELERDEQGLRDQLAENIEDHRNAIRMASDGVEWSGAGFDDEAPLPNEVTLRSVWHEKPAHILVTNYSMLERLLLQPETSSLFDTAAWGDTWKFIILDEAHCYDGALGTEIAWLVRRLKHRVGDPPTLRYLATSATLISDCNLDEPQKAQRISEEFASQIFPAAPDTFNVQFGHPQPFTPQDDAYHAPANNLAPDVYVGLCSAQLPDDHLNGLRDSVADFPHILPEGERGLFALTQAILGAENWLKKLDRAVELAGQANNPMAVGDALYLLRQVNAAQDARLLATDTEDAVKRNFLDNNHLRGLNALINFVVAGIGPLGDRDKWREWLHDYADPRPSSIPQDTYTPINHPVGQPLPRKRIGNRLHLRDQWIDLNQGNAANLTLEGLHYLLKTAVELASMAEEMTGQPIPGPMSVAVQFAPGAQMAMQQFIAQHTAQNNALAAARNVITQAWQGTLLEGAINLPAGLSLEALLAWFLGADANLENLANHLKQALESPGNADTGKLEVAAKTLFLNCAKEERENGLTALISLGALAMPAGIRRPLLDIRYHQLLRGLREVGISFTVPPDDGDLQFSLHPSDALSVITNEVEHAVFTLGACRTCGQPYALGYTNVAILNAGAGTVFFSRMKSQTHKYLHAIAWQKGAEFPDSEDGFPRGQDPRVWLNRLTGQAQVGQEPNIAAENGWMQGYWYIAPNNNSPEFLAQCPCCGDKRKNDPGVQFGVITPYVAQGSQLRLALMDELARTVYPSFDPSARCNPGEGRKILVFSDSRRGAAALAFRYQEWFNDVTVMRMMPEAARELQVNPPNEYVVQYLREQLIANNPNVNQEMIIQMLGPLVRSCSIGANAAAFRKQVYVNNCSRLLEISDPQGNDLHETEAAKVRLVQALRKKGRQTVLSRGMVELESMALTHAQQNNTQEWMDAIAQTGQPGHQLAVLCQEIHRHLFERVRLSKPQNWPEDMVDPSWAKYVQRDNANAYIRFVTPSPQSSLNKIVRTQLGLINNQQGRNQARNVLEVLWPLFTQNQGNSSVLVDVGGEIYGLDWSDIVVRPGQAPAAAGNFDPQEEYDAYLATREIIPTRIEEHTAQIANDKAAAYQKAFASGKINILSCSTTYEMGVDLGDLACVFLANLPPAVANYRQRAGRAGRRPGTAAYVLSFVGDSPHDQYFFEHTANLLFGDVQAPRIYLKSELFRARHLRAEALHNFLMWLGNNQLWVIDGHNPTTNQPRKGIRRKWGMIGDFFAGRIAGQVEWQGGGGNPFRPITGVFQPLVDMLPDWNAACANNLQRDIYEIADVPNPLDYNVAADLVWQLKTQAQVPPISPYPLAQPDNIHSYRRLAGPNQPAQANEQLQLDTNHARREVQERVRIIYNNLGGDIIGPIGVNNPPRASLSQGHLLNESTITWLARNRVLPKYGFPVDVIRLLPDKNDVHGRNVELERDLKIGLYEYAPRQEIMADKRVYTASRICVFLPGGIQAALNQADQLIHLCEDCHEAYREVPAQNNCVVCGGALREILVIAPDAFQASSSRAGTSGVRPQRATAIQIYSGGYRDRKSVDKMRIQVAESESSELMYLNFGPRYQGFDQDGANVSLFHNVKTDIAVWLPSADLFNEGGELTAFQVVLPGGHGNRLRFAMQSALEAILRAAALELQVAEREIGGLLYPDAQGGPGIGFVLFDESTGGGGAVLPLVLTGNHAIDAPRHELIRRIVKRAKDLCINCTECNTLVPFANLGDNLIPISRADYLTLPPLERDGFRERQSCYKCLRSYRNQRVHHLLDRGDAVIVLDALLGPGDQPGAETPILLPENAPDLQWDGDKLRLDATPRGTPAFGEPVFKKVPPEEPLCATAYYVVRTVKEGLVVGRIQQQVVAGNPIFRFLGIPRENVPACDVQRSDILAKVSWKE